MFYSNNMEQTFTTIKSGLNESATRFAENLQEIEATNRDDLSNTYRIFLYNTSRLMQFNSGKTELYSLVNAFYLVSFVN